MMNRPIRCIVGLLIVVFMSGCACAKAYLVDRVRDALDIVNIGIEWKGVGASAEVGPFMTGVIVSGSDGVGMLGRDIGRYTFVDTQVVLFGIKSLNPKASDAPWGDRGFSTPQLLGCSATRDIFMECRNLENFLGYCEIHVACGPGIRFGVNVFSIPDSIFGFLGLDIASDDCAMQALKAEIRVKHNK